ncbi:MAG: hypothetical protein QOC83_1190, partial [Pseudonocardiales bacterium]|nr:hypothetical protein [Pseudonocardiales bacterium]
MTVDRVDRVRDELRATLDAADLAPRWDLQLAAWLAEATAAELAEPTAMVLAS